MRCRAGEITTVESGDAFARLEADWRDLEHVARPPLYATLDYAQLVWRHLRAPSDRLVVLRGESESGTWLLLPLIERSSFRLGLPVRELCPLCRYEPGRSAGLLTSRPLEMAVEAACEWFLSSEMVKAERLCIPELPLDTAMKIAYARLSCGSPRLEHDFQRYVARLSDSAGDYEPFLKGRTKRKLNSRLRALEQAVGNVRLEVMDRPEQLPQILQYLSELEDRGTQTHKCSNRRRFYRDLYSTLAPRNALRVVFLVAGGIRIAALVLMEHGRVLYERQLVYDTAFSSFSPGVVLRALAIRRYCGGNLLEYDMLGNHPALGEPVHRTDWASARHDTVSLTLIRPSLRMKLRGLLKDRWSLSMGSR